MKNRWKRLFAFVQAAGSHLVDAKTYSKGTVTGLTILWLSLLFKRALITFYDEYCVGPVLSTIAASRKNDLVVGTAALLVGLFTVAQARRAYRPGPRQLLLFTLPGALYLLVQAHQWYAGNSHWQFTQFSMASWLRYADLLVWLLAAVWGLRLWAGRQLRHSLANSPTSYLHGDTPEATDDKLGRTPEAQRLVNQLVGIRSAASFAVGIVGQWGSGKTRFLRLMEAQLPVEAIIIRFNPWLVESTTAIRKEFFTTLKEQLGQYSGELATELNTYANSLAEVYDTTVAKAFKKTVSFLTGTPTLTEQFKKVDEVIGEVVG